MARFKQSRTPLTYCTLMTTKLVLWALRYLFTGTAPHPNMTWMPSMTLLNIFNFPHHPPPTLKSTQTTFNLSAIRRQHKFFSKRCTEKFSHHMWVTGMTRSHAHTAALHNAITETNTLLGFLDTNCEDFHAAITTSLVLPRLHNTRLVMECQSSC